jgi:hypothetical protein
MYSSFLPLSHEVLLHENSPATQCTQIPGETATASARSWLDPIEVGEVVHHTRLVPESRTRAAGCSGSMLYLLGTTAKCISEAFLKRYVSRTWMEDLLQHARYEHQFVVASVYERLRFTRNCMDPHLNIEVVTKSSVDPSSS